MSNNNYFANGRVAVLSSRLLGNDKFNKLIECGNLTEAVKTMSELGYGDVTTESTNDYELALHTELNNAVTTFVELCSDPYVARYYMARYDYHNAKTLAKCKYNRIDGLQYCYEFGTIEPATLLELVNNDNYSSLPQPMADALLAIDNLHADKIDSPRAIDLIIDKAMFADMYNCACKANYSAMTSIVECEIDTTNLITMFRVRALHVPESEYINMIIDGGSISRQWFVDSYTLEDEAIITSLYGSVYKALAITCTEDSIADAERQATALKRSMLVGTDVETVAPVLSYYNSKTIEIDKIRYIMMCIKSGLDKETTKDRLKELYA